MSLENTAKERYNNLVDGLVERREGVLGSWILEKGWPDVPENEEINAFLSKLSDRDRAILAGIAREARDSGIHDTLAYLQEQMDLNGLRLVIDGETLPVSPYDTGIFWDWTSRVNGAPWPRPT
ncbi:MAG: DUF6547 family protein [Polyangiaceae bacterium]